MVKINSIKIHRKKEKDGIRGIVLVYSKKIFGVFV